uniref:No exine formation 1 n=1 Tax=Chenopodium quinoa TaxID=63459 RepID=A0A803L1I4_CHEQI
MLPPELQSPLQYHRPYLSPPSSLHFNGGTNPNPNPRSSSSSDRLKNSRYIPSSFAHNARIAIALVPCAAFLLELGGTPVVTVLTLGLMCSYILDSLNYKPGAFFGIENPSTVLALEKLLFACVPVVAASIFTWATVSAIGMSNSSYYLMCFSCVFYWLFSLPRPSSFKSEHEAGSRRYHGGELPDDMFILGPLESCFHLLHLLFFPLLFHIASHYSVIFSSASSISDAFLLFFVPFLFLLYASTRHSLWWLTQNPAQLQSIRVVNGAIALLVVVICLEVRVVFHSFGRYIQVPPPFSYLLVTVTMLGGAAAVGAFALGMIADAVSSIAFLTLAVVASAAGALVVGFPIWLLPLPAVSGFYLARFFIKKSLPSYFAFLVLGSLMVMWFVMHNFWDLNIWMAGMSLKSFCKLIVAGAVLAMAIPGLALFPPKLKFLIEAALISHAVLLCHIENRFFNYSSIYYYGLEDDVMYPSYMVILTTFLGLALVRRLTSDSRIGPKAVWILTCLDKSKTASKMKPQQGYMHAFVVALAVWFCREAIFESLQWWYGRPPADGLLLGFCIVLIGVACIPIVALHFSHVLIAKRCLVLVVATGLLFILLQPPIPFSWTYHSDLIKAAHLTGDDISIYGFVAARPTWPSWLLIVAILLTLAATTSLIPIKYIVELRTFYSIAVGIAAGVYISFEFFPQAFVLQALIVLTMICTSVFVVFTHFPSASSTKGLPWVFALLVALFPVTYLLEGQVRIKSLVDGGDITEEERRLTTILAVEGARTSLLGLYAAIFMLIALEVKFELTSLVREKALEKGGYKPSQSGQSSLANLPAKMRFLQQRRASMVPTFTIRRMAAEGAWMPAVGNVATVLCFAICLILNINLTGGSNRAIFLLAPILLLLNQDSDFVAGFGDKQRYFPVVVVISSYLVLTALHSIWEEVWHGNAGWGLEIGGPDWFVSVKNVALLILTFPSHILFNQFVWSYAKQKDMAPLLTLPLNLPAIIITDVIKVKILGLLGVIYSLAQYLISRQQYISGLKYI